MPGHLGPLAFVATKTPERRDTAAVLWRIDAMGTRRSAGRRGLGTVLAQHCMRAAAEAGADEYHIDVVPTAVGFWTQLGFVEVEPTDCEQELLMQKGGDRPMMRRLGE